MSQHRTDNQTSGRRLRNRVLTAMIAALATIGALQAPLYADVIDEIEAEIIRTGHESAAEDALAESAEAAFANATMAHRIDVAVDLALRLGRGAEATVADEG